MSDGGPAFPCFVGSGMSLRDYFAAKAPPMPADLNTLALEEADTDNPNKTHAEKSEVLLSIRATWNYMYADAMLAARAERKGGA